MECDFRGLASWSLELEPELDRMTASVARAVAVPDVEHAAGVVPSREITLKTVLPASSFIDFQLGGGATTYISSSGRSFSHADTRPRRIYHQNPTNLDGIQSTSIHAQSPSAGIIESQPLPKDDLSARNSSIQPTPPGNSCLRYQS